MNLEQIIDKRHSVRSYADQPVEKEEIEKICQAGLHSPSARNRQPYRVIIVDQPDLIKKIAKTNDKINFWLQEAPLIFVICVKMNSEGRDRNKFIDAGIMLQNMMLMATALGLGTCPCAAFSETRLAEVLEVPKGYLPVICLPCGYPAKRSIGKLRKSKIYEKVVHLATHYKGKKVEDIFNWNKFIN